MNTNETILGFWILCAKYHKLLEAECVWQIDTLLGVIWEHYHQHREINSWATEGNPTHINDQDICMLLEELNTTYLRLEEKGISREMARQMIWEKEKVSRIQLRKNNIVALIDLDIQIKLSPTQWALYVLYLRHEDGIAYKHLPDHREELMDIMLNQHKVDDLINIKRIRRMIERLTDPTQNAIKENVSKIRKAFCEALGSAEAARHYCIHGMRNTVHRIALSRAYVDMDA